MTFEETISVKLAVQPMDQSAFSSHNFTNPNITHSFLESNGILYRETGTNTVMVDSGKRSILVANPTAHRTIILIWFVIAMVIPILIFLRTRTTNKHKQTK